MAVRREPPRISPAEASERDMAIALCNQFAEYAEAGAYNRGLLLEAGRFAVQRFPNEPGVLVAVGRMYLSADELSAARAVLEHAQALAPDDGRVARVLAGVLLGEGDARRAEATIDGAISRGAGGPEMRTFRASMSEFVRAQRTHGREAVPRELKRKLSRAAAEGGARPAPVPHLLSAAPPEWTAPFREWADAIAESGEPPRAAPPAPAEPAANFVYVRKDERKKKPQDASSTSPASPAPPTNEASAPPQSARETATEAAASSIARVEDPEKRRLRQRKRNRRLVTALALLLIAVPVGLALWQKHEDRQKEAKNLCYHAATALAAGGAESAKTANDALQQAFDLEPSSGDVAACLTRVRALQVLEQSPSSADQLVHMITSAERFGASPPEIAYLEVAAAIGVRDGKRAESLVARYDQDPARRIHSVYELSAGAALDLVGDARASDRYKAALGLEPSLFVAEVRLARSLLLGGAHAQGATRVQGLFQTFPGRPETKVLDALVRIQDPAQTMGPLPKLELPLPEEVPLSLRAIVRALSAGVLPDKAQRAAGLAAAIAESDAPSSAVFCGTIALSVGETGLAREAVRRATETAPAYVPALMLSTKAALLEGRAEEASGAASAIVGPEIGLARALVAYETGDAVRLKESADALRGPDSPGYVLVVAARDRLVGAKALALPRIEALSVARDPWGVIIAIDAALDRGEIKLARGLLEREAALAATPLGAERMGRLLRYEGRIDDARKVLSGAPLTRPALLQRAYADAEVSAEREKSAASVGERYEPERRWVEAYLVGRGSPLKASPLLAKQKVPAGDAPLSLRIAAGLALGASRDQRGEELVRGMVAEFRQNPDVIRAAVGLGILPASALKTPK
jgi:tetratricopeptide (TPR) repeat protein